MSVIKEAVLTNTEHGNDPNDNRSDPNYLSKIKLIPTKSPLDAFALNGKSKEMLDQMLDDKFILGEIAILGQSTVIYARPNAGKTLITIKLLIDSIKSGQIQGEDVYYVNADDNHKGLAHKLAIAEKHGFKMITPGHKNFKRETLLEEMEEMTRTDTARGKIVIIDTVKKFTEVMDKRIASKFCESVRQFVSKGGSAIMLAHVNKHGDAEGKVIFSGTSDIVDDSDCCYTLEIIEENKKEKVVEFDNFKNRGDVIQKALFSYTNEKVGTYSQLLDSVVELNPDESKKIAVQKATQERLDKNQPIIEEIKLSIANGITGKTELIEAVRRETGESRKRVFAVLKEHTGKCIHHGQLWTVSTGEKNSNIYSLNDNSTFS